ncbi:MAG: cryptochrome/photolyase family protein [Akkermansiaceae bacterium]|jgi:deoxyribodipyrimidine photolyase-related protein
MDVTLVFPHQLFEKHPALDPSREVFLLEDALLFGPDPHWPLALHRKKLILHRASMKAYAASLTSQGFKVSYLDCQRDLDTLSALEKHFPTPPASLHFCDPVDHILSRRIQRYAEKHKVTLSQKDSPNFLSPTSWLDEIIGSKKKPFMAIFYKAQRKRMDILMDSEGEPVGGKWSFDEDNRKKLPKTQPVPEPPSAPSNDFVEEAQTYVAENFPDARGSSHGFAYAIDHTSARKWLVNFFHERFHLFGDYEDAIHTEHRIMFHSVLTPALNIGLLSPEEVVHDALAFAKKNDIPLNTTEGFIRQIIGWREFMRAMYQRHGVYERNSNFWGFTRQMPAAFYDGTTGIDPIDETIHRVLEDGYCHHIERLMVLGNFMLLCRIHPTAVYQWFMELFVDAYDWVMVPNVYGMSQFADGGLFTTKPYLSGSNYICKMSNYKKSPWCPVWDGLFWSFVADYQDVFLKNHRMSQMGHMLNRMDPEKRALHRKNADEFLASLD